MATTNIKVLVKHPGNFAITKVAFPANISANDIVRIPRRVNFGDIVNISDLRDEGLFRVPSAELLVSTDLGGSVVAGVETNLGLTLPRTEKLILLGKASAATKITFTLSGNKRTGTSALEIEYTPAAIGEIFEIDLYDLGLRLENTPKGAMTIASDTAVSLLLIARF